jgi:hypothetical protein
VQRVMRRAVTIVFTTSVRRLIEHLTREVRGPIKVVPHVRRRTSGIWRDFDSVTPIRIVTVSTSLPDTVIQVQAVLPVRDREACVSWDSVRYFGLHCVGMYDYHGQTEPSR